MFEIYNMKINYFSGPTIGANYNGVMRKYLLMKHNIKRTNFQPIIAILYNPLFSTVSDTGDPACHLGIDTTARIFFLEQHQWQGLQFFFQCQIKNEFINIKYLGVFVVWS